MSASTHALWASIDPEQNGPYHEDDWRIRLLDEALRQARADALKEAAQAVLNVRNDEPVSKAVAQRLSELARHILGLGHRP